MSKERLVELLTIAVGDCNLTASEIKIVADYLLANGVVVPRLNIADRIYQTDGTRIYESLIHEITYTASKIVYVTESIVFDETAIGTSIFLTREEAEAKLKETNHDKAD